MPEMDFKTYVEELHARINARHIDHFELLGLPRSATFKEIEQSYRQLEGLFTEKNIAALGQGECAAKARNLRERFDHAHEVLTDYSKRRDYENRGFHEPDEKERIELPPEMARKIFAKAKVLFTKKEYALCLDVVDQAIQMDPRAEYHRLRGLCLMNTPHRQHEAEASLLKATEIEPWNAEHFLTLGMLFYNEKLPQRALGYFQKTLELDSGNLQARRKLEELEGPRQGGLEKMRGTVLQALRKILPSVFGRR
jgi:tetratricopeptide (TPR) repeat protein